jgi:hypothetical protein
MQLDFARRVIQSNNATHHSYVKEAGLQRTWASSGHYKQRTDQIREKELKDKNGAYLYYRQKYG